MLQHRLFNITQSSDFHSIALDIFRFQFKNNQVYREFCMHLGTEVGQVNNILEIPFLPIEFFKSRRVVCNGQDHTMKFLSSGTTGMVPSIHYVADLSLYEESFRRTFELFYGSVKDYCILALLPSYLGREGSSLVYMVNDLIKRSGHSESGFYLNEPVELKRKLVQLQASKTRVLLIGVSFALLDFVKEHPLSLNNAIIMETGGMKGRGPEIVRQELHARLKAGFGVSEIHSEYGMTELLSQAYSTGNGQFRTPGWMKVLIRDPEDPLTYLPDGKTGGLNVIDFANLYSCSFIATQDLGKIRTDGSFEILGRFDHSDIRGCNLMVL